MMSQFKINKNIIFFILTFASAFAFSYEYKSNENDNILSRFLPWEMKAFGVRVTQKDQVFSLVGIDGKAQDFIKNKFSGQRIAVDMIDGRSALSLSPCVLDKKVSCMGHINIDSKRYDLFQINSDGSAQVTECQYITNQPLSEKSPQLKNCFTYSASSCEKWSKFKSQNKSFKDLKDLKKKINQCQDLLSSIQAVKTETSNIFRTNDSTNAELAREFEVTRDRSQADSRDSQRAKVTSLSLGVAPTLEDVLDIQKFDTACEQAQQRGFFLSLQELKSQRSKRQSSSVVQEKSVSTNKSKAKN